MWFLYKIINVFPTFLSIAGIKITEELNIDGQDISSLVFHNQDKKKLPEVYYYYYYTHLQAVRKGDWKLVLPRPQAPYWLPNNMLNVYRREDMEPVRDLELYNLKRDISERRDVAKNNPEKVKELLALVEKARNDIGDYNIIGEGARFFDTETKRPDALHWQEKDSSAGVDSIKLHPFYDDGARIMRNSNHFNKKK